MASLETRLALMRLAVVLPACLTGTVLADDVGVDPAEGLKKAAAEYRIEIDFEAPAFPVRTTHGVITGEPCSRGQLERYAPLFLGELGLYPPELVAQSRLKRITFCRELSFAGQKRAAIPDFEHDELYLDVGGTSLEMLYLTKVFHHEFYHVIDYVDDGLVYEDERWRALNPERFAYGTGGRNARHVSDTSRLTTKNLGFLNHYSTTGVEEDKAEVFANLMVEPAYVEGRIETDLVLQAKVERMKETLREFCPQVDEEFWRRAASRRAGEAGSDRDVKP